MKNKFIQYNSRQIYTILQTIKIKNKNKKCGKNYTYQPQQKFIQNKNTNIVDNPKKKKKSKPIIAKLTYSCS